MLMTRLIVSEYIALIHKQSLHMSREKSCTSAAQKIYWGPGHHESQDEDCFQQ